MKLSDFFGKDVRSNIKELLGVYSEMLDVVEERPEDIKEQEDLFQKFEDHPFKKKFDVLADVQASYYFGNEFSKTQYENLLDAFRGNEDEWKEITSEEWVKKASDSAPEKREDNLSDEKRFFHWKLEFPEVFFDIGEGTERDEPGFDAVIGNPPYVKWSVFKDGKLDHLKRGYYRGLEYECRPNHKDAQPNIHLFFQQLSYDLVADGGLIGLILPQEWTERPKARDFRDFYLENCRNEIVYFDEEFRVFNSVGETIGTNSLILRSEKKPIDIKKGKISAYFINSTEPHKVKSTLKNLQEIEIVEKHQRSIQNLIGEKWVFDEVLDILVSIEELADGRLSDSQYKIGGGFQPPTDLMDYFTIDQQIYSNLPDEDKKYAFPVIKSSKRLQRYYKQPSGEYWIILNEFDSYKKVKEELSEVHKYLEKHKNKLLEDKEDWWKFPRIRNFELIKTHDSKIMSPRTGKRNSFCLDKDKTVFKGTNTFISHKNPEENNKLLGYLNSVLITSWYSFRGSDYHSINRYEPGKVKKIPTIDTDNLPPSLGDKATKITRKKKEIANEKQKFLEWVEHEWGIEIENLSLKTRLKEYWKYDFDEFMRVAKKNKSKIDENVKTRKFRELMEREWENSLSTLRLLMKEISELENEIDAIVFDLYDSNEDEVIAILDSLETGEEVKQDILEKFRGLNG